MAAGFVRIDSPKPNPRKDNHRREETYHIVERDAATAGATVEEFAKANGQVLLPLIELVAEARVAVDEVIDRIGRQTIETILTLSAEQVVGPRTPGKSSGDIRGHGSQNGRISLADRQIKVKRPRLRHEMAETAGVSRSSVSRQALKEVSSNCGSCASGAGTKRICWCSTSMGNALDHITLLVPWAWTAPELSTYSAFKPARPRTQRR